MGLFKNVSTGQGCCLLAAVRYPRRRPSTTPQLGGVGRSGAVAGAACCCGGAMGLRFVVSHAITSHPSPLQLRNQSIFEASGLALINGTYYVVFDSSESLGYLDE